jgi:hypothetical protein
MKRCIFASVAALALASCTTMHEAAVSTFRVVDAPHQYIRRQLGVDEEPQTTTTTTTTTEIAYGGQTPPPAGPPPQGQPYSVQPQPFQSTAAPPAPASETRRETTARETPAPPPPHARPSATPRIATNERTEKSSAPARTTSKETTEDLPYAKPVPGKPGYVYSPFDPNGGYVDVKGFAPGQKVKDPYSGKIFRVP